MMMTQNYRPEVLNLPKRILVTGAAGFIGSHLVDKLLDLGYEVVGFDNLSSGDEANLTRAMRDQRFVFVRGDLNDTGATKMMLGKNELIFHLAADPEVRVGEENPLVHFRENLLTTLNLLEAIRNRNSPTKLVFASTSTIYGEASLIPTPEDYGPLLPISTYGATKLGCEVLSGSYTQLVPLEVAIFRFANVVGARAKHGVIYDFMMKLRRNPRELEILGDGTQTKSYLHIDDCVDAFLMTLNDSFWKSKVEPYNIGTEERTNVLKIGEIVCRAMHLSGVEFRTTQGPGGRAWPGDVGTMQLDISKIKRLGWKPNLTSDEAVRLASEQLIHELGIKPKGP
jgi:UDP-glucose 4-epimerase